MPSVLFDATAMPLDRGGVGRYIEGVLPELGRRDIDLSIVCQSDDRDHLARLVPTARMISLPARYRFRPLRLLWEQLALPLLARRLSVDIVHSAHYTMPILGRATKVVSMFDAIFFSDPRVHTLLKRTFFRAWIRFSLRHADMVVVCSDATRTELLRYVPSTRAPVVVAHLGVDSAQFHRPLPDEIARLREHLALGEGSWIGFLGTLEPRKNVSSLVRAYDRVAEAMKASSGEIPTLVIAGGRGWDDTVDATIAGASPAGRIIRPGYLPLELLSAFLGGADVFVYPSSGEGFGLPVLEAMSTGALVLTTRNLSLPEVGGDAVVYCETDPRSIAAGLESLLASSPQRNELRAAAVSRAAHFTWSSTADAHLEAYAESMNRGSTRA